MATNLEYDDTCSVSQAREISFVGDNVFLAAQIDYPDSPAPADGYPLLVILHHAGGGTRADYAPYANTALEMGFAVFRWDKRGAGRSGGSARGSTHNDTLNAYKVALSQPAINRARVVILALADGTLMLRDIFDTLAQTQHPYAALLVGSLLDRAQILALKTRLYILMGDNDWISWHSYGREASRAHAAAYPYGAQFNVVHFADRLLMDTRTRARALHLSAKQLMKDWLRTIGKL